jgi:hypothetical protein
MTDGDKTTSAAASSAASAESRVGSEGDEGRSNNRAARPRARTPATEEMIDVWWQTDFGIHKSLRYHAKRRSFFDGSHRLCMAINAIAGGGAAASAVSHNPMLAGKSAILVGIASAVDVSFGLSAMARKHDQLYQQFGKLAADMAKVDVDHLTNEIVRDFRSRRLTIESKEAGSLEALNVLCHNEEVDARGWGTKYRVGRMQIWLAQLVTLPGFDPRPA